MMMEVIMNIWAKTLGTMIILALAGSLILVPAVSAIPPLPCEYYGQVEIDGAPAPAGTVISAVLNGSVKGMVTTVAEGSLGGSGTFDQRLVVSAREEDTAVTTSPDVVFYIDGIRAEVVDSFGPGESHAVILAIKTLKAFPGFTNKPSDLDGDGIYEDLNGNGRLDFADVVLYFDETDWIRENQPLSAFDINRNGRIDFADVVELFNEV